LPPTRSYCRKAFPEVKGSVCFGSEADICVAQSDVRFAPNGDRESRLPQTVMSALPPKADMCGATADVRFGSKADICSATEHVRFTPNSDIDCVFWRVCFGPKADIAELFLGGNDAVSKGGVETVSGP